MIATRSAVGKSEPTISHARQPSVETINGYYEAMRRFWHPVLPSDALVEDEPRAVVLLSEDVVLARLNGEVVAMQDLCRHFQAFENRGGTLRSNPGALCPLIESDRSSLCREKPILLPSKPR